MLRHTKVGTLDRNDTVNVGIDVGIDVDADEDVNDDDDAECMSVASMSASASASATATSMRYVAMLRHLCPHVAPSVAAVSRILRRKQQQMSAVAPTAALSALLSTRCHTELEGRLGRIMIDARGRRRFVPGVTAEFMARLLAVLEPSDAWCETQPWTQSIDRIYTLPSGIKVRTTSALRRKAAVADAATTSMTSPSTERVDAANAEPPQLFVTHVTKTRVASVDLQWKSTAAASASVSAAAAAAAAAPSIYTGVDVRVTLNDEAAVPVSEFPVRVDATSLVRIKQRRSFRYKAGADGAPLWSIDLTLVWSAPTHLDALKALRSNATPVYEVELECLRPASVLADRRQASADTLALSLLLKLTDMYGAAAPPAHMALVPI
jgi:hypothetical protein